MRRFRRFAGLPATERHLLVVALLSLLFVRLGLSLLSFGKVSRLLANLASVCRGIGRLDEAAVEQIPRAISRAGKVAPGATCLVQALAAQALLRWQARPANLQIGVARDDEGQFIAHAWLESAGAVVLGGQNTGRYQRLLSLRDRVR